MDADAGLRRDALGEVLRALTHDLHHTMTSALAGEIPRSSFRLDGCKVSLIMPLSAKDRRATGSLTGLFSSRLWSVTDPREAMELLQVRGLAPGDDERRGWLVRECSGEEPGPTCTCGGVERSKDTPGTIPDLIAYASLGPAAILRAEELARETVARLRPWGCPQPERVVWLVGVLPSTSEPHRIWTAGDNRALLSQQGRERVVLFTVEGDNEVPQASDVQRLGLALDSITADAITLVVPPISGAQ